VAKRRETKIMLPFADTPVITRNKEMRKASKDGHRRSSTGLRGRRASSLIDSGMSNGEWKANCKKYFRLDRRRDFLEDWNIASFAPGS
jgi:hypothetical protein